MNYEITYAVVIKEHLSPGHLLKGQEGFAICLRQAPALRRTCDVSWPYILELYKEKLCSAMYSTTRLTEA